LKKTVVFYVENDMAVTVTEKGVLNHINSS